MGTHFAMRVPRDSMIEAGINEDDFVIVRKQDDADSREIVVALLGEAVTVKRRRKKW